MVRNRNRKTGRSNIKISSKLAQKRKNKRNIKLALYAILFVALIWGLSALSRADFIAIEKIEVEGAQVLNEENIQKIAEANIDSKFLKIFSRSNTLIYPKDKIISDILGEYKRISKAEVSIEKFSILKILIEERKPFALFCNLRSSKLEEIQEDKTEVIEEENLEQETVETGIEEKRSESMFSETEECFYLDKDGFIFDSAPTLEGGGYIKFYGDISSEKIGQFFLSTEKFGKILDLIEMLKSLKFYPVRVLISDIRVEAISENGERIIWKISEESEEVFANLTSLIGEQEFRKFEKPIELFEYVDLRFIPKVLYKLK